MCEPVRTAQSVGDDTYAVATGATFGHESTDFTALCGPSVSVGGKPGSSMGARTRTRAMLKKQQAQSNRTTRQLTATHAHTQNRQPRQSPNALNSPTLTQSNPQRSNAHCSMLLAPFYHELCSSLFSFTSLPSLLPSA